MWIDTIADFFDIDRRIEAWDDRCKFVDKSGKIGVALWLYCFLQCIEVKKQPISTYRIDDAVALVSPKTVVELDKSDIGKEWYRRTQRSDIKRRYTSRIGDHHTHRSESKSHSSTLGSDSKITIYQLALYWSACHRADDKRPRQLFAKE